MRTVIDMENIREKTFSSRKARRLRKNIVFYIVLSVVGVFMLLPTFVMLTSSVKTYEEYYSLQFRFFSEVWAFDNYVRVFSSNDDLFRWLGNTLFLILSNTVICTVSTIFVAYGFAKFRCKVADGVFMVLLCTMMIPWAVTMIPSYIIWAKLGLTNTFVPLVLPSIGGSAYYTFMFKQNMRGIPNEITEAAEIDGANSFVRLWTIIVPNCIPAIATMRTPEKFNISLGLNMLRSQTTQGRQDTPMLLAASVLMAIPSIAMYFVGTKVFAKGISLQGGVKG